jgi:FecR protein
VNRSRRHQSSTNALALFSLATLCLAFLCAGRAAVPFASATVTKVENDVSYGERRGEHSSTRPATVSDTVHADNFLLTKAESRAELQYPDGSVVRVGQNAVFTFDSDTRTLSLEKGSLLFHIPKGAGGGTIKTPSLTAAITGTAGKVSTNIIAIVEGVITLIPSGRLVHVGEFARRNPDGSITIAKFDASKVLDGKLVFFNGLMPGFAESVLVSKLTLPDEHNLRILEESQNLPGSIFHFFPNFTEPPPANRSNPRIFVPPPNNTPPIIPPPSRRGGHGGNY